MPSETTKKEIGKVLAWVQEAHPESRFVGDYYHFSCAGCGQGVGRSGHIYPPYMIMKCYQSGCTYSHKWVSAYRYLADTLGRDIEGLKEAVSRSYKELDYQGDTTGANRVRSAKVVLPKSLPIITGSDLYAKTTRSYLKKRGFDIDYLWTEFHLTYTGATQVKKEKELSFDKRIIIPFQNYAGELVYFQARDYTGDQMRWLNPKNEKVIWGKSEVVYNEQALYIFEDVFVCEGAADVWEMQHAVGVAGKQPSPRQLSILTRGTNKRFFVAFDYGTYLDSLTCAFTLLATGKDVYIVDLPKGDCNELGYKAVMDNAAKSVHLTYDNFPVEYSRIDYLDKGKTVRGKEKGKLKLW